MQGLTFYLSLEIKVSQFFLKLSIPCVVSGWVHIFSNKLPGIVAMWAPARAESSRCLFVLIDAAIILLERL